jgi:hypothetical protein
MKRRTFLSVAAGSVAGLAGCSGVLSSEDGGDSENVVGEPPDDPDQELRLTVTVRQDGDPLADETVIYHDHGGTYDRLEGTTDDDGEIVFVDSMGPPPCNPVEVEVPDHDELVSAGCHNGGKELSETIDVESDS